jgi:hypothetical protein
VGEHGGREVGWDGLEERRSLLLREVFEELRDIFAVELVERLAELVRILGERLGEIGTEKFG